MHTKTPAVEYAATDTGNSFGLLQYEISRVKSHLETNGESPVMRERLRRLEDLLETCQMTP